MLSGSHAVWAATGSDSRVFVAATGSDSRRIAAMTCKAPHRTHPDIESNLFFRHDETGADLNQDDRSSIFKTLDELIRGQITEDSHALEPS